MKHVRVSCSIDMKMLSVSMSVCPYVTFVDCNYIHCRDSWKVISQINREGNPFLTWDPNTTQKFEEKLCQIWGQNGVG